MCPFVTRKATEWQYCSRCLLCRCALISNKLGKPVEHSILKWRAGLVGLHRRWGRYAVAALPACRRHTYWITPNAPTAKACPSTKAKPSRVGATQPLTSRSELAAVQAALTPMIALTALTDAAGREAARARGSRMGSAPFRLRASAPRALDTLHNAALSFHVPEADRCVDSRDEK
jgi:hypothetical protein